MRAFCFAIVIAVSSIVAPVQQVSASVSTCAQYQDEALAAGWRVSDWPNIRRIMWRESRCEHWQYNGKRRDRSYGLMQINTKGALWGELQWRCKLSSKDQLFDPFTNLACAKALHRAYGWRPWRV